MSDHKKAYELDQEITQDLSANGSLAGVEADEHLKESEEPFDPEQISIDGKVVPMDTLIRRLVQGSIQLAPAFQRKEVWDSARKSRLIESMMLKIPLPMFYVAADEKGNWDVVDGLQRLTTIKEFVLGIKYLDSRDVQYRGKGLKLHQLEFWGERYNGLTFKELPEGLVNRILETEFRFTIINPGTPEEVKRNIFKRINTGGMPLTAQEIRHALYQGKSSRLLARLAESDAFAGATDGSVNDSRMAARELVLRFLAFSIRSYTDYPKTADMDSFLSDTMRIINIMPEVNQHDLQKIFKHSEPARLLTVDLNMLKKRFVVGMVRSSNLFGKHAFRRSSGSNRRAPINKTLFEVWGNLLADLSKESFEHLTKNKVDFLREYSQTLTKQEFGNLISRDSWKHSGVQSRYKVLSALINAHID